MVDMATLTDTVILQVTHITATGVVTLFGGGFGPITAGACSPSASATTNTLRLQGGFGAASKTPTRKTPTRNRIDEFRRRREGLPKRSFLALSQEEQWPFAGSVFHLR